MFFSVSKTPQLNFSANWNYHGWCIDTDQGWHVVKHNDCALIYKGYINDGDLHREITAIADEATGLRSGNFCLLIVDRDSVRVQHSTLRSFPLWYGETQGITNLRPLDYQVWADSEFTLLANFDYQETKLDILGDTLVHSHSRDAVVDAIDQILVKRFTAFTQHNQLPIKIFISGGIDTVLMYSYLRRLNVPHELILGEHMEFDQFWVRNHQTIGERYWSYTQLHHWRQPTVLVSGCPGDEFSLRNPLMSNLLALHHGCTITELLDWNQNVKYLHRQYFNNTETKIAFENHRNDPVMQAIYKDRQSLQKHLLDRVANDHQHWHLGNTLTFTPMRDLEILRLCLSLPWADQMDQMLDSGISRELIQRNDPKLSGLLSPEKNTNNYLKTLDVLL
jgi:hypothetical protein